MKIPYAALVLLTALLCGSALAGSTAPVEPPAGVLNGTVQGTAPLDLASAMDPEATEEALPVRRDDPTGPEELETPATRITDLPDSLGGVGKKKPK